MTLHEVTRDIFLMAKGHIINGERFTRQRLSHQLYKMTRPECGTSYIFEISLNDGAWLAEVTQYRPGKYGWYVPETREQEQRLWEKLMGLTK